MTDNISDMLTVIRNGYLARLKSVEVPHSKMKVELAKALVKVGYLIEYNVTEKESKKYVRVVLRYVEKLPAMSAIERVSKPGRRIYVKYSELKPVVGGKGSSILSTPKGLISDKEAKKLKIGGEVICRVW